MIISGNIPRVDQPCLIQEGIFGANVNQNGELLFLRMEMLTEATAKCWDRFKQMSYWVANQDLRGVLSTLVSLAGESTYPSYEKVRKVTGFSEEEYNAFTEKAISLKARKGAKIVRHLASNSVGIRHMETIYRSDQLKYIVYITKNPDFSIQNADKCVENKDLRNFFNSYSDILITVGSDFSEEQSFHNRGISRNPYWVFEEKYSGLAMLLFSFTGMVADKYFRYKISMHVKPVGSILCIIKRHLLPGESYIEQKDTRIDITEYEVKETDPEQELCCISVVALKRTWLCAGSGI